MGAASGYKNKSDAKFKEQCLSAGKAKQCDWTVNLLIFEKCKRGLMIGPQGSLPGGAIASPCGRPPTDQSIVPIGVEAMIMINRRPG